MDANQQREDIGKARMLLLVSLSLAHVERAAQQVDMELAKEVALLGLKFAKKASDLLPEKDRGKAQLEYMRAEAETKAHYKPGILET